MNAITKWPFGHFVGFDALAHELENFARKGDVGFPRSNVIKTDEHSYLIEVALAGYRRDDVTVEQDGRVLSISADSLEDYEGEYVHRGISTRAFKRTFRLSDNMEVKEAVFEAGLLSIRLEEVVPKSEQPKLIKIK